MDASTLKREVAEGVDLMVVRELTGGQFYYLLKIDRNSCLSRVTISYKMSCLMVTGIYFGEPRGIKTNENGEEVGFNTEVYAAHEVLY